MAMKQQDNLFTYLKWRGDIPFSAVGPGAVDAMILSQFVYVDLAGLVPAPGGQKDSGEGVTIREIARHFGMQQSLPVSYMGTAERDRELLMALGESRRYGELTLDSYVDDTDMVEEKQFAAVRIHLSEREAFISYRGTDGTLVGWKENFNMFYQFPGPGQRQAVEYLNAISKEQEIDYYLCGHSKGGNLAMTAAIFGENQEQIRKVYMFDAPGFFPEIWKKPEFERISGRVESYVPETSIVGVLLNYYPGFRVVHSLESGASQHVLYTWILDGPDFSYTQERDHPSVVLEENLKGWLERIPQDQRQAFVDAFFEVLAATGITRFAQLREMTPLRLAGMIRNMSTVSPENRETLLGILRQVRGE